VVRGLFLSVTDTLEFIVAVWDQKSEEMDHDKE
jgi:hypothetical protein